MRIRTSRRISRDSPGTDSRDDRKGREPDQSPNCEAKPALT